MSVRPRALRGAAVLAAALVLTVHPRGATASAQSPVARGPAGLFLLSQELVRRGEDVAAEPLLAEVVRRDPDAVLPRLEWAAALLRLNRPLMADSALAPLAPRVERLAHETPLLAARWFRLRGALAARDGAGDDAARFYERASDLAPGDLGVHVRLVGLHRARGDTAAALPHLEALAHALPRHVDVRIELGEAQLALGRWADAERSFRSALALEPDRAAAWDGLGRALAGAGRTGEAERARARADALSEDGPAGPDAGGP